MRYPALIFLLLLTCLLALPVGAEESGTFGEKVPEEFGGFLEDLPDDIAQLLPPEIFSQESGDVGGAVGKISNFSFLLHTVLTSVGLHLKECFALFATVTGLLLLSSVFAAIRNALRSDSIGRAFSFCSSLAILSALLMQSHICVNSVVSYFETLNKLTVGAVPLLGVLYAMGGNVTAAAASARGLTVYLTILEEIVGRSVVPFCGICLALVAVETMCSGIRFGTLTATIKKQYTTLLAFLMMLLLAMLAAQTTLGARADTLAMRSAKFAAGNLIPVVGGSVSELIRTVSAGVGYLRGTIGVCGILLILLSLFPTLIELLIYRFVWQVCASLADMLGCGTEKRLLDEIASLCGYLIAAVSICSSVLLLALSLLVHCVSAIG